MNTICDDNVINSYYKITLMCHLRVSNDYVLILLKCDARKL